MVDLQCIMRKVLARHICPSNGAVIRRHKERCGEDIPLVGGPAFDTLGQKMQRYNPSRDFSVRQPDAWEGWGDDVAHYYVLEDMLKLDPMDIMQLYQFCAGNGKLGELVGAVDGWRIGTKKQVVETHVAGMGDWFLDNGQTLGETVNFVVSERGEDEIEGVGAIVADGLD